MDWSISLGNVITILTIAIGFWVREGASQRTAQDVHTKVNLMFDWFQKHVLKDIN